MKTAPGLFGKKFYGKTLLPYVRMPLFWAALAGWDGLLFNRVFPDFPLPCQPALHFDQGRGFDVAGAHAPFFDRPHNAAVLQDLQVPHEGRQRHLMRCVQFTDAGRARSEPFDHGPAGWVGHRAKEGIELFGHAHTFAVCLLRGQHA